MSHLSGDVTKAEKRSLAVGQAKTRWRFGQGQVLGARHEVKLRSNQFLLACATSFSKKLVCSASDLMLIALL